jgi:hypothetical protein
MKIFGKNALSSTSVFQKHSVGSMGEHPHSARIFGKLSQQSFKQRNASAIPSSGSMFRSLDDFRLDGANTVNMSSNTNINFEPRNELTKRSGNGLEKFDGFRKKQRM